MGFLRQETTILIPRVHHGGRAAASPSERGPFIIMEYVEGTHLSTVLQKPAERDGPSDPGLDPAVADATLRTVYRKHITGYLLQLARARFLARHPVGPARACILCRRRRRRRRRAVFALLRRSAAVQHAGRSRDAADNRCARLGVRQCHASAVRMRPALVAAAVGPRGLAGS